MLPSAESQNHCVPEHIARIYDESDSAKGVVTSAIISFDIFHKTNTSFPKTPRDVNALSLCVIRTSLINVKGTHFMQMSGVICKITLKADL